MATGIDPRKYDGWARRPPRSKSDPAKKRKDHFAAVQEAELVKDARLKRTMGRLPGGKSKVSNPRSRSNPFLDRAIIQRIHGILQKKGVVALTNKRPRPVSVLHTPYSRIRNRKWTPDHLLKRKVEECIMKEDRGGQPVHKVYFPNWAHISWQVKAIAYSAAIPSEFAAAASVHLSPTVMSNALRSRKGFMGYLQDRVARELRNRFLPVLGRVPDFMMVVEGFPELVVDYQAEKGEPFHLHGVLDLSWNKARLPDHFWQSNPLMSALKAAAENVPIIIAPRTLHRKRLFMALLRPILSGKFAARNRT